VTDQYVANLYLLGSPRMESHAGERIEISSKKGIALLAALATTEGFERSRVWLQQMLWGSRAQKQAQSSLRRELSNLRTIFAKHGLDILRCDQRVIGLKTADLYIDVCHPQSGSAQRQFCEGLDLASEDEFEEWLRDMRIHFEEAASPRARRPQSTVPYQDDRPLAAKVALVPPESTFEIPQADALAKRIGMMLSNALTKIRWLPVTSNNPVIDQADSDARYLIQTQIVGADVQATINFSLLEMPGKIIRWTESRTINLTDESALQAEISRVANCVGMSFDNCEQRHFTANQVNAPADLAENNWRVRFHIDQFTKESFARADYLINQAMERHPENGELLMLRANLELWQHWIKRADTRTSANLAPLIRAAMRADPADARGPLFQGILETWHRRGTHALRHLQRACELDPSMAQAFVHLGAAHYLLGDPEAAIPHLEHALFLAPLDAKRFFAQGELGTAYWMLGRYEESLAIAQNIQGTHPNYVLAHVLETASYSAMGCLGDARVARAQLLDEKPHLYRAMLDWIPFHDRAWIEKLRNGIEFDGHSRLHLRAVERR
jgi:tetratricopeptide (TPR) repeat protein